MQRPKWLSGWGKGKNLLEGSLIIDIPDIKVVEASFNENLALFAIGTTRKLETTASDEGIAGEDKSKSGVDLDWRIFYDSTVLSPSFPIDKVRNLVAGIVAVSSGSTSVYDTSTVYIASGRRPSKGNAPLLLYYEMAKKIEEAKKEKTG